MQVFMAAWASYNKGTTYTDPLRENTADCELVGVKNWR
jgi:hypothetical protein